MTTVAFAPRATSSPDDVLSPRGRCSTDHAHIAPRLDGLAGKRIGLLDNKKANADILLDEVGKLLAREYGATVVLYRQKHETARAASSYGYIDELVGVADAVVNAYGDCGSCTSWGVHDSVDLEKRGIPVATVNTDEFASLGQFDAIAKGLPGLPIVTVAHPVADNSEAQIRQKAQAVMAQIVSVLVGDSAEIEAAYTGRYIMRAAADRKENLFCEL